MLHPCLKSLRSLRWMDDECLTLEVLMHIAFEVISQLSKAEESRWLSPKELSLHDFLVEQFGSSQLVVEVQGVAPSLIHAYVTSAQDQWSGHRAFQSG
jgi:hypothetical protein